MKLLKGIAVATVLTLVVALFLVTVYLALSIPVP